LRRYPAVGDGEFNGIRLTGATAASVWSAGYRKKL
jgi:hypothetical protein